MTRNSFFYFVYSHISINTLSLRYYERREVGGGEGEGEGRGEVEMMVWN